MLQMSVNCECNQNSATAILGNAGLGAMKPLRRYLVLLMGRLRLYAGNPMELLSSDDIGFRPT